MKQISFFILFNLILTTIAFSQNKNIKEKHELEIYSLIDNYSKARENRDSVLLKSILTSDIDQLVSTGERRFGKQEAVNGMAKSSNSRPGTRTITVEKIRLLNSKSGIVDAKYVIQNSDGTARKMWSTFIVVYQEESWKITAIRNMLPAR